MKLYKVIDERTGANLFIGTKQDCKNYAKSIETIWQGLKIVGVKQ